MFCVDVNVLTCIDTIMITQPYAFHHLLFFEWIQQFKRDTYWNRKYASKRVFVFCCCCCCWMDSSSINESPQNDKINRRCRVSYFLFKTTMSRMYRAEWKKCHLFKSRNIIITRSKKATLRGRGSNQFHQFNSILTTYFEFRIYQMAEFVAIEHVSNMYNSIYHLHTSAEVSPAQIHSFSSLVLLFFV